MQVIERLALSEKAQSDLYALFLSTRFALGPTSKDAIKPEDRQAFIDGFYEQTRELYDRVNAEVDACIVEKAG